MVTLRDYLATDASRLVTLANNKNISQYLRPIFPFPYTIKDANWWITTGSKESGMITQVIEHDGIFVGSIGLTPLTGWRIHVFEIGYWIGEAYWGLGIATSALKQMTDYAFSELEIRKLIAPVLGPNKASMRVLEKQEYELEGILKNEVQKDGQYFDIYRYAKCVTKK